LIVFGRFGKQHFQIRSHGTQPYGNGRAYTLVRLCPRNGIQTFNSIYQQCRRQQTEHLSQRNAFRHADAMARQETSLQRQRRWRQRLYRSHRSASPHCVYQDDRVDIAEQRKERTGTIATASIHGAGWIPFQKPARLERLHSIPSDAVVSAR
jgi:hypothetical protein